MSSVTSHDVAALAGVSQPTVSRALREAPGISPATRQRVREAADRLGYVPSAAGRALSLGRTGRIGLLVTDLDNAYYPLLIEPVHRALAARDHELVLQAGGGTPARVAERVLASGLDGVLMTSTTEGSDLPDELRRRGVPCVCLQRGTPGADLVDVDPTEALTELVGGLLDQGHQRVAVLSGPSDTSTGLERARVVRDVMDDRGIEVPTGWWRELPFTLEAGQQAGHDLLSADPRPTAVVCASDLLALGVLNTAATLGLRVPDDLAVTGFDDLPMAGWPLVQLSTVGYDVDDLAAEAVDLLLARIDQHEPSAPQHRRIRATARPRRSTAVPTTPRNAHPHQETR
ncbi:LacI family DNA-binding transcriptional regulator [Aestuariimicrobium ganziense]|uniref:LacI family DNA-binding transcriptional regulator n=1 Tax=Aestuariimicrobium ganziense TaxID=2773677 RepID=UPI0019454D48|nr:LacI family DNA-binding transcriptional regulator [Aestuariimicrobium ganziense]